MSNQRQIHALYEVAIQASIATQFSEMPPVPSAAELLANVKDLTRADGSLQKAWSNSFIDPYHCREQGGFIYVGPYPLYSLANFRLQFSNYYQTIQCPTG